MTEKDFYEICDKLENAELPSGLGTYFPTPEFLLQSIEEKPLEEFLPVLQYYASDPFKGKITSDSYKETVKLAMELTCKIPLT